MVSTDGRLLLFHPHQVDVSLIVTHLRQSARDVRLLKHLGQTGEGGQRSNRLWQVRLVNLSFFGHLFVHSVLIWPLLRRPLSCDRHRLSTNRRQANTHAWQWTHRPSAFTDRQQFDTNKQHSWKQINNLILFIRLSVWQDSFKQSNNKHTETRLINKVVCCVQTFSRYWSMLWQVIDGSVMKSNSSLTVITATPCFTKNSGKKQAERQTENFTWRLQTAGQKLHSDYNLKLGKTITGCFI